MDILIVRRAISAAGRKVKAYNIPNREIVLDDGRFIVNGDEAATICARHKGSVLRSDPAMSEEALIKDLMRGEPRAR